MRKIVLSILPASLRPRAKSFWKKLTTANNRIFEPFTFRLWLVFQCMRHRKKAIILCRTGALGDIICTLPMCEELRKRHPGSLLIFVTHYDYKSLLALASGFDEVYGGKSWEWPFALPQNFNFLGLVEAVYSPRTRNEISNEGPRAHLVDDLADSCSVALSNPHPQLNVPPQLLKNVQVKYGISEHVAKGHLIIGINCGQVWPVRMWLPSKWQELLDLIHAEYDAAILLFGFRKGDHDEYDDLKGIQVELRMPMTKDELVALVANCHLMITVDSGTTHISGATSVPVVGVYGALNPDFFLPRFSPAIGLFSNVPCLFCNHTSPIGHWKSGCPYDIRCMKELQVKPVFEAVKSMVAKTSKPKKK